MSITTNEALISAVYSSLPYENQIEGLEIKTNGIVFNWRGERFVVKHSPLYVGQLTDNDVFETGDNISILLRRILEMYINSKI